MRNLPSGFQRLRPKLASKIAGGYSTLTPLPHPTVIVPAELLPTRRVEPWGSRATGFISRTHNIITEVHLMKMRTTLMALFAATALSATPALAEDTTEPSADTQTSSEATGSAPVERIATMSDAQAQFDALMLLVGKEIDVSNYKSDPDAIQIHDISDMLGQEQADELRAAAEATGHLEALQITVFADVVHEEILDAAGYTQDDILGAQLGDGNTLDIFVY
jgi:hypothetical protein